MSLIFNSPTAQSPRQTFSQPRHVRAIRKSSCFQMHSHCRNKMHNQTNCQPAPHDSVAKRRFSINFVYLFIFLCCYVEVSFKQKHNDVFISHAAEHDFSLPFASLSSVYISFLFYFFFDNAKRLHASSFFLSNSQMQRRNEQRRLAWRVLYNLCE